MRGGGGAAILEAFPIPLGSTVTLFIPPAFAGPCVIPLMGTFPIPGPPAARAHEAAGVAKTSNDAKAIFAGVFDKAKLHFGSLERRMREGHVGSPIRPHH
jgi:hypothetical protein